MFFPVGLPEILMILGAVTVVFLLGFLFRLWRRFWRRF